MLILKLWLFAKTVWKHPHLLPVKKHHRDGFTVYKNLLTFWYNDRAGSTHAKILIIPKFLSHYC